MGYRTSVLLTIIRLQIICWHLNLINSYRFVSLSAFWSLNLDACSDVNPYRISLSRELEKQRESSSSDIAKKKQEAESAVSLSDVFLLLCFRFFLRHGK